MPATTKKRAGSNTSEKKKSAGKRSKNISVPVGEGAGTSETIGRNKKSLFGSPGSTVTGSALTAGSKRSSRKKTAILEDSDFSEEEEGEIDVESGEPDEEDGVEMGDEGVADDGVADAASVDDDDEDEDLPDNLATLQDEKDCVKFLSNTSQSKNMKSGVWQNIRFIDVDATLCGCPENLSKEHGYHGIQKLREPITSTSKVYPSICVICFETPNVSLLKSLCSLSSKKKANGTYSPNISNFNTHAKRRGHKGVSGTGVARSPGSTTSQVSAPSLSTIGMSSLSEWVQVPKMKIIHRLHEMLYILVNDANVPAHIVKNRRLWDIVEFIVLNSTRLHGTDRKTLEMGPYKFASIQAVSFGTMISTIDRLVEDTRMYFRAFTQKEVPFIYIGHDIWDGKNKSVLGLCIFFISPLLKKMVMLPVGIVRAFGKKASYVADMTFKALLRYNIKKKDLRKQMNDTTTAALKAGRLIVGNNKSEDRFCGMHIVELAVGHASGYLKRSANRKIIDQNEDCLAFRNKVRICAKQFSDRKSKSKMEKFREFCKNNLGMDPIKIPLPNKTRVAGNFRMYEGLLRSFFAVTRYVKHMSRAGIDKDFDESVYLNKEEWQQLAEYCAIYEKTTNLVMQLQSDSAGSLSIAKLLLTQCVLDLSGPRNDNDDTVGFDPFHVKDTKVVFEVTSVNHVEGNLSNWAPCTPYKELPRQPMCLPLQVLEDDMSVENGVQVDNRKFMIEGVAKTLPCMSEQSRHLVQRLVTELKHYFGKTTKDEMVCMFLNPFVQHFGLMEMIFYNFFPNTFLQDCQDEVVIQIMNVFSADEEKIKAEVTKEHENLRKALETPAETATNLVNSKIGGTVQNSHHTAFYRTMQMKMSVLTGKPSVNLSLEEKQNIRIAEAKKNLKDNILKEIELYKEYLVSLNDKENVDWIDTIMLFPSEVAMADMKEHKKDVRTFWESKYVPMAAAYGTKLFDIVRWWLDENHGGQFKHLQGLAVVHLSQPYTNAFVERVFSRGTWVDDIRAQRTLDTTFEMRVLDAENREFVEYAKPILDEKSTLDGVDGGSDQRKVLIKEAISRLTERLDDELTESVSIARNVDREENEESSLECWSDMNVADSVEDSFSYDSDDSVDTADLMSSLLNTDLQTNIELVLNNKETTIPKKKGRSSLKTVPPKKYSKRLASTPDSKK